MQTILAVDDEAGIRESYRFILSDKYRVLLTDKGESALRILQQSHVDLVLLDLMMPGISGMEVLAELSRRGESVPVIVITALNSVANAVAAIKQGAREYIIKPFDVDQLQRAVARTLEEQKQRQELRVLREEGVRGFESLIGDSSAFQAMIALARKATAVDSTVLVTGESGTGKDLLARAIHSGGKRKREPFVVVSCCAIPATLVESELFGHEKGAFTGATERRIGKVQIADRGTLFLDEIGEMPLEAQAKMLRVLQDGQFYPIGSSKLVEVDARFICATNRNLREAVTTGIFREDLFYRVNVLPIEVPPLRRRREDIPGLVTHFLVKYVPRINAQARQFSPEALLALASYSWPGNIRELENVLQRVLVHHNQETVIRAEHLSGILPTSPAEDLSDIAAFEGFPLEEATRRLERHLILRALSRCGFVKSRAAELLGTTRRILGYKMEQLGIESKSSPEEEEADEKAS
ncbi:MAG: sigma-54-dependent Fis family transcriptional regulator [Candidatus Hydrogenedentes bacterium]|nr:sigma-54-dependent Fis family transcriptional regulator [Candidatus Hydrogenedentota bacterium]